MRFLVCGGRDFGLSNEEWWFIHETLSKLITYEKYDYLIVIHGAAPGADSAAGDWAKMNDIPCVAFPADWDKYGLGAGPIRNKQMLDEGKPDWIIAFPGGTGTANMISQGKRRGVKVKQIEYNPGASPLEAR